MLVIHLYNRKVIISLMETMILATDVSQHGDFLAHFKVPQCAHACMCNTRGTVEPLSSGHTALGTSVVNVGIVFTLKY